MRRSTLPLFFLALTAAPMSAQTRARAGEPAAAVRRAVETITPADVQRRIGILADDSMRGRITPSPQLEQVAAYIAGEFRRLGLRPGGDNGTFQQRYTIRRTQIDTTSFAMVMGRGAHGHWALGRDAYLRAGPVPEAPLSGPVVLMVGMPADQAHPFGDVSLSGAIVLQVVPSRVRTSALLPTIAKAAAAGARGWITVTDRNAGFFAQLVSGTRATRLELVGGAPEADATIPVVEVLGGSAASVLTAAGEDLAALRASTTPVVRALGGVTSTINVRRTVLSEQTAPNVIGILEGSDPQLRGEYVFFTAHMDHIGTVADAYQCRAAGADSTCNGADDDASGTTGVLELAEAFATMNPRPRRSLVFMTVSGEERGLWGSEYYSEHPTLPLANTVADLNIDMIGRNWRDTIVVIGKEHSSLGEVANRVTTEHPELNMQLVDDRWPDQRFYFRSDHYNFARKGVPILFFFNGVHADYHRATDSPDKIDAEKEARIIRMAFYIGLDVANTTARPQWNPESRRRIVEAAGN